MEEWWGKMHSLLIVGGLTYDDIRKSFLKSAIAFREGVIELFQFLELMRGPWFNTLEMKPQSFDLLHIYLRPYVSFCLAQGCMHPGIENLDPDGRTLKSKPRNRLCTPGVRLNAKGIV